MHEPSADGSDPVLAVAAQRLRMCDVERTSRPRKGIFLVQGRLLGVSGRNGSVSQASLLGSKSPFSEYQRLSCGLSEIEGGVRKTVVPLDPGPLRRNAH